MFCAPARPANWRASAASTRVGFWNKLVAHPAYDDFWQRAGRWTRCWRSSRSPCRPCWCTACGTGRHLRRARRLQGDQAEGQRQRQGVPGHGPVAARPADRRRQHTGRHQFRQRHRAVFPPEDPAPFLAVPEGRRRRGRRHRPGHRLRDRHQQVAQLAAWPMGCASGCAIKPTPLLSGGRPETDLAAPGADDTAYEEYIVRSGQAGALPRAPAQLRLRGGQGPTWPRWLVDDQREASGRTDV